MTAGCTPNALGARRPPGQLCAKPIPIANTSRGNTETPKARGPSQKRQRPSLAIMANKAPACEPSVRTVAHSFSRRSQEHNHKDTAQSSTGRLDMLFAGLRRSSKGTKDKIGRESNLDPLAMPPRSVPRRLHDTLQARRLNKVRLPPQPDPNMQDIPGAKMRQSSGQPSPRRCARRCGRNLVRFGLVSD